jgi:hypothetical protein
MCPMARAAFVVALLLWGVLDDSAASLTADRDDDACAAADNEYVPPTGRAAPHQVRARRLPSCPTRKSRSAPSAARARPATRRTTEHAAAARAPALYLLMSLQL